MKKGGLVIHTFDMNIRDLYSPKKIGESVIFGILDLEDLANDLQNSFEFSLNF